MIDNLKWNDSHLLRMTDDTGIFQHSLRGVPDPSMGYTTDDNARALMAAIMLYGAYGHKKYEKLIYTYMSFLIYAQNENGKFKNFMDYNRNFSEKEGSSDCFGRCIMALGFTLNSYSVPLAVKRSAYVLLKKAIVNCNKIQFLRSKAYCILGLANCRDENAKKIIRDFAYSLKAAYEKCKDKDWHWFENEITYCNAVMSNAMLCSYEVTGDNEFLNIGLESLNFLCEKTFRYNYFKPIGCSGWLKKGSEPAIYDEQPVEACTTLMALVKAFDITHEEKYVDMVKICFQWYTGTNSKGISLIDSETYGCFDGITENGVNLNQGSESIVCYCIASMIANELF